MRILKLVGISIAGFIGLMLVFLLIGYTAGDAATAKFGDAFHDFVTIFVFVAIVTIIVRYVKKNK